MMPTSGTRYVPAAVAWFGDGQGVARFAVPVWTGVHAEEIAAHPPARWKRVLCAFEDDPRDLPVLRWAAEFVAEQKLEVRLVHAVRGPEECEDNPGFREFLCNAGRAERIEKLQDRREPNLKFASRWRPAGQVIHRAAIGLFR